MAEPTPSIASLLSRTQIGFAFTVVLLSGLVFGGAQVFRLVAGGQEGAAFVAHAEAAALADSVSAADADRVQTDLLALRPDTLVSAAAVYNAQGALVAQYRRDASAEAVPEKPLPEGQTSALKGTETTVGIWIGGQPVGALYLRRGFDWPGFALPLLLGLAASLVLSALLASAHASRLGPRLAKPLAGVADATLHRLRAELETTTRSREGEAAEVSALRDTLRQAQNREEAVRRALAERDDEIAVLKREALAHKEREQATKTGGDSRALIRLAEEVSLLPADAHRDHALALTETAAVLAAEPEPSSTPFDPAALAAEAALAARLRVHASGKKETLTVAFDAFPASPPRSRATAPSSSAPSPSC